MRSGFQFVFGVVLKYYRTTALSLKLSLNANCIYSLSILHLPVTGRRESPFAARRPAFFLNCHSFKPILGFRAERGLTYNIGSCAIRGVPNLKEIPLEMVSTILNLAVRKRNLRPSITIKIPRTAHSRERCLKFYEIYHAIVTDDILDINCICKVCK